MTQVNEATKAIISVATHTDGINIEVTAHGYAVGDLLRIGGTTDYNGRANVITVVDVNNVTVNRTYTSTQTGTTARGDKDHENVGALTEVTILDLGVTGYPYKIYDGTGLSLVISGDMTLDQFSEQLLIDQFDINSGGTYACGIARSEPASAGSLYEARVPLLGMHIKKRGTNPQNDPGFQVQVGGTFILNGAMILMHSGFRSFYTSEADQAHVEINDGYIYMEGLATQNSKPYKVRFDGTDVVINGLKQYGGAFSHERTIELLNFEPTHYEGWQVPAQADPLVVFVAKGYLGGGRGNIQDVRWSNTMQELQNCATGPNIIAASHGTFTGLNDVTQEFQLKITDLLGGNIEGARFFIRDFDNGNRVNYSSNGNNRNYGDDRTYTELSNVDGETAITKILTSASVDNGINNDGSTRDHRNEANDVSALFDIPIWHYNYVYSPILAARMISKDVITFSVKMAIDADVTGTVVEAAAHDIVIADDKLSFAINESMSMDDVLDYLKWAKTQVDTIEFPTISTKYSTLVGDLLDCGELDITLADGIELSPGEKARMIATNGTITFGVNAIISAPYRDSTGVTANIKTTPVECELRIEEYNAAGTTLLNTHTGKSSATGLFVISVEGDAKLRIYAKEWGYEFDRTDHDMSDGLEVDASLIVISHIDTSKDITAFTNSDIVSNVDKLYFTYDELNHKGNWVSGIINLTNQSIVTAALLDHRITTQEGLAFFAWFNVQSGIDTHLNSRPFVWSHDRLELNEDHMQFLRAAGMTGTEISRLGVNVKKKDGETNYDAPASNNSRVQFDNLAVLVPKSVLDELSEQTSDEVERDGGTLDTISTNIDTIIADVTSVETKSDSIITKVDEVKTAVDTLDTGTITTALTDIETKADTIITDIDSVDTKVDALDTGTITTALSDIETKSDTIITKVNEIDTAVDTLDTSTITSALTDIEAKSDTIITDIDAVDTKVDALDTATITSGLTDIETKTDTLITDLASVDTHIDTVDSHIGTIDANVDLINTHVDEINDHVDVVSTNIDTINTHVDEINDHVDEINEHVDEVNVSTMNINTVTSNIGTLFTGLANSIIILEDGEINILAKIAEAKIVMDSTATKITSILSKATDTLKSVANRWTVDPILKKLHIYDDDKTTVHKSYNLKDASGNPDYTDVFDRDPV